MNIHEFIEREKITMTCETVARNPHMADMPRNFLCTLDNGRGGRLETHFSQGSAHTKDPSASGVLECLALDSAAVENAASFEEWAYELGYDSNSRAAKRTYNQCRKSADELKKFLGGANYRTLLFEMDQD